MSRPGGGFRPGVEAAGRLHRPAEAALGGLPAWRSISRRTSSLKRYFISQKMGWSLVKPTSVRVVHDVDGVEGHACLSLEKGGMKASMLPVFRPGSSPRGAGSVSAAAYRRA